MASSARIDELKKKFDENPRRYFAPLANEFRKMGEIEQAIMICEEFLPQQAGHMSGHIVYGQALYEAGRLGESRTVFETALTLDPENLIALRHLGDIAKGNGELETARHWYTRVLDADPRNEEIQALLYSLDDTPAIVIDETRMGAPAAPSGTVAPTREEQRFAPPPTALPQLPKTDAAPPPPLPAFDLAIEKSTSAEIADTAPHPSASSAGAEPSVDSGSLAGLESSEFVPPPRTAAGGPAALDNFEAGEFTAPTTSIAPLPGLEETSVGGAAASFDGSPSTLPPLDLDDGSTLSPQGDAVAPPPAAPPLEEFAIPDASAGHRKTPPIGRQSVPTDWRGFPALGEADASRTEPSPEIPAELPPAVIAAEAELVYLVPPEDVAPESVTPEEISHEFVTPVDVAPVDIPAAPAPFVTETMAELFVKQGFREQALDVYRQLLAASPEDERLRAKVAELQPAPAPPNGPTVREFFARLATRRPGERSATAPPSADDFASFEAVPELQTPPKAPEPPRSTPMSSAVDRAATTQSRSGGSIDALFGNRAVGTSEDSAASALAQAFGGSADAPPPSISGRPARAAAQELSLDSVFRDGGARAPRPSGSFSFDQFFSEGASGGASEKPTSPPSGSHDVVPPSEPAERTADDISQFNSWLQGLKQR
jgi:tetratricopeptide (TPR) repeat protein